METAKYFFKKYGKFLFLLLLVMTAGAVYLRQQGMEGKNSSGERNESFEESTKKDSRNEEAFEKASEKGYDLPVDEGEREEAEADCKSVMGLISDIYEHAEKGNASNVVISKEALHQMVEVIKKTERPVTAIETYSNMENYEKVEGFLTTCKTGKSDSIIIYKIRSDGGIGREKYIFDGTDMYVLTASASWNQENKPAITYISYNRIKAWQYTEKGWFCYELCVPEFPEVTEVVDGSSMLRVKPMNPEYREISEKYLLPLGYQGNNLLCSNWNKENMDALDYNGMFEYLYQMKYQEKFPSENYPNGIPKEEFENLIMEYLPITSEQIRKYAAFDEENQAYIWETLGCANYAPTYFGTSVPEVTDIKENEDGTVTLTVDAVCEMTLYNEAVITHELTIRFFEDGSFQYLGNKILGDGLQKIPVYQYRRKQ